MRIYLFYFNFLCGPPRSGKWDRIKGLKLRRFDACLADSAVGEASKSLLSNAARLAAATNTVRWRHHIRSMLLSLSLLVSSSSPTATALTDAMSESVPFFFYSDFRKDIFLSI